MSKKQIYNRIGEGVLGALIGSGSEYYAADVGGEDDTGKVISALKGAVVGGIAGLGASAAIRTGRGNKRVRKIVAGPKYRAMTDRLSALENKFAEKQKRFKDWDYESHLADAYKSKRPMGYPQHFEGAMDMLKQRQADLAAQKKLLKEIGDPGVTNPRAYVNKAVAGVRAKQIQSDVNALTRVTSDAQQSVNRQLAGLEDEMSQVKDQMRAVRDRQNEFLSDARHDIFSNLDAKFMGLV